MAKMAHKIKGYFSTYRIKNSSTRVNGKILMRDIKSWETNLYDSLKVQFGPDD